MRSRIAAVVAALVLAGCGESDPLSSPPPDDVATSAAIASPGSADDCIPTTDEARPLANPDRRIEDIVEFLTGQRQIGDREITFEDPNFGGAWGDRRGGVVVAVLDCSQIDVDEIARIAGGPSRLHLIEVPHTFEEVNGFRDALVAELDLVRVRGDVYIQSTLTGRHIEVHVLDPEELPPWFGSGVPSAAFTIVETEGLIVEG